MIFFVHTCLLHPSNTKRKLHEDRKCGFFLLHSEQCMEVGVVVVVVQSLSHVIPLPFFLSSNFSLMLFVFFNLVFIRLLTFPILNQISSFQSSINHLLITSHSHCFYCYCHPTPVLHSRRKQPCSQPLAHDSSFHVPFFPQLKLSLPPVLAEEYLGLRNRTLISSLCSSHD